jgi:uncharacterized protein (TIGR02145 family)
MKKLGLLLAIFCSLQANGQPFSISFSGTSLSTVKVQNLTTGVIVDVPAGDVLHLSTTTDIQEGIDLKSSGLKVYPNPMTDKSTLTILPPIPGDAIITISDMTGKVLTKFKEYLDNYTQEFSLSDIKNGLYVINVRGNGYRYSTKILSNGRSNSTGVIVRKNNNSQKVVDKKALNDSKGFQNSVDMIYNAGERLKFTAVSGNNRTVMTDIPTADKTVTFIFTECKDGDNNFYPIVQIGIQTWMADNLKTTKYNDNSIIPLISNGTDWFNLTTSGYCWYNNEEITYKDTYGALYNWYAINSGQLCPIGWHVPTDEEWTILHAWSLTEQISANLLRENGIAHWKSPNTGATNETGFTALPGGGRDDDFGAFVFLTTACFYWSSTEYNSQNAWFRKLQYNINYVVSGNTTKKSGYSVRCLKN